MKMGRPDMRRWTALAAAMVFGLCLAAPIRAAGNEDDLKVIKRAVRGDRSCEPEKGVKWFKLLITDNVSRKDVVKVNLPIFVIRLLRDDAKDKQRHCEKAEVKAALRYLKRAGSLTLFEIVGDDSKIKIWLE
jgi:hypothetical protein